jgi:hypothetical protein
MIITMEGEEEKEVEVCGGGVEILIISIYKL